MKTLQSVVAKESFEDSGVKYQEEQCQRERTMRTQAKERADKKGGQRLRPLDFEFSQGWEESVQAQ
jgi:hypothetical protein